VPTIATRYTVIGVNLPRSIVETVETHPIANKQPTINQTVTNMARLLLFIVDTLLCNN
jgi:hypothetical protein